MPVSVEGIMMVCRKISGSQSGSRCAAFLQPHGEALRNDMSALGSAISWQSRLRGAALLVQ